MSDRQILLLLALVAGAALFVEVHAESRAPNIRLESLGSGLRALWLDADTPTRSIRPWLSERSDPGQTALPTPLAIHLTPFAGAHDARLGLAPLVRASQSSTQGGLRSESHSAFVAGEPIGIWSSGAVFESEAWRFSGTHAQARDGYAPGVSDEDWRVGMAYRINDTQLSTGWERTRHDGEIGAGSQAGWRLGMAQRVGDGRLRFSYRVAGDGSGAYAAAGLRQMTLGYERGLSTQSAVYAFYTRLSNDPNGRYGSAFGDYDAGVTGTSRSGIGLGVRLSF